MRELSAQTVAPVFCIVLFKLPIVMGPVSNSLPSRPRFSWYAKSPPCTDDKRNQEKYNDCVLDWKEYLDTLRESRSNNVLPSVQGVVLKSQLYCEAADFCSQLTNEQLKAEGSVQFIIDTVYQRDFVSVISEAYEGSHKLLNTRRSDSESLESIEMRFSAAVVNFSSLSTTSKLP